MPTRLAAAHTGVKQSGGEETMLKQFVTNHHASSEEEEGATAVEYGLMVALIAVAILSAVMLLGNKMDTMFTMIAGLL